MNVLWFRMKVTFGRGPWGQTEGQATGQSYRVVVVGWM